MTARPHVGHRLTLVVVAVSGLGQPQAVFWATFWVAGTTPTMGIQAVTLITHRMLDVARAGAQGGGQLEAGGHQDSVAGAPPLGQLVVDPVSAQEPELLQVWTTS